MQEDAVPYITRAHFEEAMKSASRSVSDAELRRYEAYAQQLQQTRGVGNFQFSGSEHPANSVDAAVGEDVVDDDDLYS